MLSKLFSAGAKPSADDLRAAIAAIDVNALQRALSEADASYKLALLEGEIDELERAEATRNRARLEIERAHARRDELERRLADTEVAERKAAAEKRVSALKARRDSVVSKWNSDLPKAYRLLKPIVDEIRAIDDEIRQLDHALIAGRDRELIDALGDVHMKRPLEVLYEKYFFSPHVALDELIAIGPTKTTAPLGRPVDFPLDSDPTIGG